MKYWCIVWKDVFLSHLLNENENIINLVTGYSLYFLKISKINAQQEKPICPNRKNWVPQNTKNGQSAKINSHKNFVPHGILLSLWLRPLKHMNDGRNKRALLELDSIFFRIHRCQVSDRQAFSRVAYVIFLSFILSASSITKTGTSKKFTCHYAC